MVFMVVKVKIVCHDVRVLKLSRSVTARRTKNNPHMSHREEGSEWLDCIFDKERLGGLHAHGHITAMSHCLLNTMASGHPSHRCLAFLRWTGYEILGGG